MAREDSFKKRTNKKKEELMPVFDSILEEGYTVERENVIEPPTSSTDVMKSIKESLGDEKRKRNYKPKEVESIQPTFKVYKKETVGRYYKIDEKIVDMLDSIVKDENGEAIKGSKGIRSTVVQNGIIRELVAMGAFNESALNLLEKYWHEHS